MRNTFAKTEKLLRDAARIAEKEGLGDLEFSWSDLGDLYHVYGVNATGRKLVDMLKRRSDGAGTRTRTRRTGLKPAASTNSATPSL